MSFGVRCRFCWVLLFFGWWYGKMQASFAKTSLILKVAAPRLVMTFEIPFTVSSVPLFQARVVVLPGPDPFIKLQPGSISYLTTGNAKSGCEQRSHRRTVAFGHAHLAACPIQHINPHPHSACIGHSNRDAYPHHRVHSHACGSAPDRTDAGRLSIWAGCGLSLFLGPVQRRPGDHLR